MLRAGLNKHLTKKRFDHSVFCMVHFELFHQDLKKQRFQFTQIVFVTVTLQDAVVSSISGVFIQGN